MHVKRLQTKGFKRFTDLTIDQLPASARLVILTGPNGCGKSSLFDAFRTWHEFHGGQGVGRDEVYHRKTGATVADWRSFVSLDFHEEVPQSSEDKKKTIYVRSAYRNEPDFALSSISRMGPILDCRKVSKLIENDSVVSENYQRLVSASVAGLFSGDHDSRTVPELRELLIGEVRRSVSRMFDDLTLVGPGDPLKNGAFYFEKGASRDFHYKNLSGGEKAAFDLILDIIVKRMEFDDTIYCIDEPDAHMHTRLQGRLLEELLVLIPANSQLWIATHSIGMMRKAKQIKESSPESVVFLDFHRQDFDTPVVLQPKLVNRDFWISTLGVALDDLAALVAPSRLVLCEGRLTERSSSARSEFDARCYRTIFAEEFCDTDFLSVGNSSDVESDRLQFGRSIQTLLQGTQIVRVVDRDDRSATEVADLKAAGVRILSRRHLESYLLDDEIIKKLCESLGEGERLADALQIRQTAVADSVSRGNAPDDIKSAAGQVYTGLKSLLGITGCGNSTEAFLRDTMAPLVTQETQTYQVLRIDLFG